MNDLNEYDLVCLHGGPGMDSWVYKKHLSSLFGDSVIFYDQKREADLSTWVDELIDLVSAKGCLQSRKVVLLAHSSGGCIASRALKSRPDLFAGAIFLAAPVDASADSDFMQWMTEVDPKLSFSIEGREAFRPPVAPEQAEFFASIKSPLAIEFYNNWELFFDASFKDSLEDFIGSTKFCFKSATNFYTNDFPEYQLLDDLDGLSIPCIYFYPVNDRRIVPIHAEKVSKSQALAFKVVPGSHFCFVDEGAAFKDSVMSFCKSL